jgi:hypothetical protein
MRGELNEFTLAELLQLFALAEKSGIIEVTTGDRTSRLFMGAGRVSGWGQPSFDLLSAVLRCELLGEVAATAREALDSTQREPGLDFIIRNLLEPHRWEWFTGRLLEQDIFPLLTLEHGAFEVSLNHLEPPPVALNLSVQGLILDGSRWEADMQELAGEGFTLTSSWRRSVRDPEHPNVELSSATWLIWAALSRPDDIRTLAERVGMPDLDAVRAVRALQRANLVEQSLH